MTDNEQEGAAGMEQAQKMKPSKPTWIPQKERIWVLIAVISSFVIIGTGLSTLLQVPAENLHKRSFEFIFKNYGSLARIGLFFVLAHYVLLFILQKGWLNPFHFLKKWAVLLSRFARKWHTPIAMIAIGLIFLHVVGAFMYGFEFDFSNISGLLALIALLPVPIAGLFRYRRLDRKWHLRSGLAFAFLFLVHSLV